MGRGFLPLCLSPLVSILSAASSYRRRKVRPQRTSLQLTLCPSVSKVPLLFQPWERQAAAVIVTFTSELMRTVLQTGPDISSHPLPTSQGRSRAQVGGVRGLRVRCCGGRRSSPGKDCAHCVQLGSTLTSHTHMHTHRYTHGTCVSHIGTHCTHTQTHTHCTYSHRHPHIFIHHTHVYAAHNTCVHTHINANAKSHSIHMT